MKRAAALALLFLAASCGNREAAAPRPSNDPISVRGWIADIDTGETSATYRTVETEAARRAKNFQETNVWVDNAPYVSGGISDQGAFVLLDVPPGTATITFSAPGVPAANLPVAQVPSNADVLVPGLILKPNGVAIADPKALQVRVAGNVSKPEPAGLVARIAGIPVTVMRVPVNTMTDRRDYPAAPALMPPTVATVK